MPQFTSDGLLPSGDYVLSLKQLERSMLVVGLTTELTRSLFGRSTAFVIQWWLVVATCCLRAETPAPLPVDRLPPTLVTGTVPRGLDPKRVNREASRLSSEQVQLGRRLFFDASLSQDRTVSCATCHRPDHGFAGVEPRAVGIRGQVGQRNAPSVLNRAFGQAFFWDGRAASLEEQALKPIENPKEMASTVAETVARLKQDATYVRDFQQCFPDGMTAGNLAKALASFQRVLLSGNSPVDRFLATEVTALSDKQRHGLWLFDSKGRCWRCHSQSHYSDESYHNTGVSWGKEPIDLGRFEVTRKDGDRGRFKTPSLRDVSRTAPYMHDGSLATLRDVVEFYNRGGTPNPHLDEIMKPLQLGPQEVDSLVGFLEALDGDAIWDVK